MWHRPGRWPGATSTQALAAATVAASAAALAAAAERHPILAVHLTTTRQPDQPLPALGPGPGVCVALLILYDFIRFYIFVYDFILFYIVLYGFI